MCWFRKEIWGGLDLVETGVKKCFWGADVDVGLMLVGWMGCGIVSEEASVDSNVLHLRASRSLEQRLVTNQSINSLYGHSSIHFQFLILCSNVHCHLRPTSPDRSKHANALRPCHTHISYS